MEKLIFENVPESEHKTAYLKLIEQAKTREISGKFERHHIIPRSLGGSNDPDNLVQLSLFEHVLAHYYLANMTQTVQMWCAFKRMYYGQFQHLSPIEQLSLEEMDMWERTVTEAKEKAIRQTQKTLKEKYGSCTGYMNRSEIREKAKQSRKERYGTELGRLKDPDVILKRNEAIVSKYGNLCGMMHTKEAIQKSQQTQTEKYGCPAGQMHTKEAIQKSQAVRKSLGNGDCMWGCHSVEAKVKRDTARKQQSTVFHSEEFKEWRKTKKYGPHAWMTAVSDFLQETGKSLEDFTLNE